MICYKKHMIILLVLSAAAAVIILTIARDYQAKAKLDNFVAQPLPPISQERNIDRCEQDIYSMDQLRRMCASYMKLPTCMVERIDHLRQEAFRPAKLRLPEGRMAEIFLSPLSDVMSNIIAKSNVWEESSVRLVLTALKNVRGSALIDIGSNFGVYSLSAAIAGFKVVAVDAYYQMAMRLRKSAEANGVTDRLTVYWNALSASSGTVKLRFPTNCDHVLLMTFQTQARSNWLDDPNETASVRLDDVTVQNKHLKGVQNLILKVDIEGSEWNVFATGEDTFKRFNVSMVLMEWFGSAKYLPEKTLFITDFLISRGF